MNDVDEGLVDVVLVYKIDRLSRSLLDFARLMERFRKAGVFFVCVTEPFLSADSDAMAQLLLNVLMAFAQFERQMIAERIRDKVTMARRKGLWTGGNVPFGYRIEARKLLCRADEAPLVGRIYSLYLELRCDAAIVHALDADGTLTRQGRRWTTQSVARVLTNPVYTGYITLGEELHEGDHLPLIARERFEQVQALRRSPDTKPQARGRNPDYLLRGLLHCACGYALTPASTRRGKLVHRYYRSIAKDKQGKGSCNARPLRAETIEALVRERIAALASTPAGIEEVTKRIPTRIASERQDLRRQKASLKERIDALAGKLEQLNASVSSADECTKELYEARIAQLTSERDGLRGQLRALEVRLGVLENLVLEANWIAEQMQHFGRVWDQLLPFNRQRLVRSVVQRIEVEESAGTVDITLQPWCAALAKGVE